MKCPKCGYQSFNYLADCKKCGRDLTELQGKFGFSRLVCPEGPAPKRVSEPVIAADRFEEEGDSQPETAPPTNETHRKKRSSEESLEVFFQSLEKPSQNDSSTNAESIPGEDSRSSSPVKPVDIDPIDSLPDRAAAAAIEGNQGGDEFDFPFEEMDADLDALQQPLQEDNEPFLFDIPLDEPDEGSLEETFAQEASPVVKPESNAHEEDLSFPAALQGESPREHSDGDPAGLSDVPLAKEDFFSFHDLAEDLAALAEAHDASFDWGRSSTEEVFESTSGKNFDRSASTSTGCPDTAKWPFPETALKNNYPADPPRNPAEESLFDATETAFAPREPEDSDPKEQQRPQETNRSLAGQSSEAAGSVPEPPQDLQPEHLDSDLEFELLDADEAVGNNDGPVTSISQEISAEQALLLVEETGQAEDQGVAASSPRPGATLSLRLLALLADLGILSALFFLFVLAGEMARAPKGADWFRFTSDTLLELATPYFLVLFALCFGYFTLSHYLTGQSPGKMLWGIRVEAETGGPLSLAQAFLRTVGGLAAWLPVGLGFLSILVNRRQRGWNDQLANSRVVGAGKAENDHKG